MGSWAGLGGGAHRPSGWLDIAGWSCRIDLHPITCGSSGASRQWTVVGGGGARDGGAGRRDPAHRIGGGAGAVGRRRRGSSVEPAPQCRGDPKARAPAARSSSDGRHGGGPAPRGPFFFGPVEGGAASGSEAGGRLRGDVRCFVPRRCCVTLRSGSESRAAAISCAPLSGSGWPVAAAPTSCRGGQREAV